MYEKVLRIVRSVNSSVPDNENTMLFDEGYIDSFGAYAILVQIEIEFSIQIFDSELNYDNFKCIKSLVQLINRKENV